MKIVKTALAGTLESSDLMVTISPGNGKREIHVKSKVGPQYLESVLDTINEVLDEFEVADAVLDVVDQGAFDFAIKARVETAIMRGSEVETCL